MASGVFASGLPRIQVADAAADPIGSIDVPQQAPAIPYTAWDDADVPLVEPRTTLVPRRSEA
eukprot:661295-Prymnesium_polylepis.1